MALWPFGKKNKAKKEEQAQQAGQSDAQRPEDSALTQDSASLVDSAAGAGSMADDAGAAGLQVKVVDHDPVGGDMGPFDGDKVAMEEFDFSDFSTNFLDLGSLKVPLPKGSQVQVEMGESGPKMLHVVTTAGRITPVAFAAPRSSGQWAQSVPEIVEGMERDGLPTRLEEGPWGTEVVGENANGTIRIIGIEAPRWMLRLTLAAPKGKDAELATVGRELAARVFVYRGDAPILAGSSLPVTVPAPLVEQLQKAMQEREEAQKQQAEANSPESQRAAYEAAKAQAREQIHQLHTAPLNGEQSPKA